MRGELSIWHKLQYIQLGGKTWRGHEPSAQADGSRFVFSILRQRKVWLQLSHWWPVSSPQELWTIGAARHNCLCRKCGEAPSRSQILRSFWRRQTFFFREVAGIWGSLVCKFDAVLAAVQSCSLLSSFLTSWVVLARVFDVGLGQTAAEDHKSTGDTGNTWNILLRLSDKNPGTMRGLSYGRLGRRGLLSSSLSSSESDSSGTIGSEAPTSLAQISEQKLCHGRFLRYHVCAGKTLPQNVRRG